MLSRLVEVLLVETLRSAPAGLATTGLLAGLRDWQLVVALRAIHTQTAKPGDTRASRRDAAAR